MVLGAAKTNIAHLEGSAGIAGFLKSLGLIKEEEHGKPCISICQYVDLLFIFVGLDRCRLSLVGLPWAMHTRLSIRVMK